MPKRADISSILVIGSGPIIIGQACEFDYSGTQAVKALKEEGYRVILVNSNPATIMTDPELADRTYIEPITVDFLTRIIEKERPDALLPTIGGQTALNVTLELEAEGVLEKYNVEIIGANTQAIKTAEDRQLFKEAVTRCGYESAKSYIVRTLDQAQKAVKNLGYPFIIRPSRTLGGTGSSVVTGPEQLAEKLNWGFEMSPIHELLLEESLIGWKEIELEVMRDCADNGVIICTIENLDPMGVHTGDSITVAPVQTLTDKEYQCLRNSALAIMNEIGVDTGGSNVQFAICPKTGRQIVIEMNPRVSRSSALASKATGFPIAKIAAKLAVGYTLDELPNDITKTTPASFEPSIDYVVVKIPRFNFEKFEGVDITLGTQMKSVGEAMAIGRTFCEALQKACRSLEVGRVGLLGHSDEEKLSPSEVVSEMQLLTPSRVFLVGRALELGISPDEIFELTGYDRWFTNEMLKIVNVEQRLRKASFDTLDIDLLKYAKQLGESDCRIAELLSVSEDDVRALRHRTNVRPAYKMVDTCAAEFASDTPYLYSTYDNHSDAPPSDNKKIVILGGGPNRIGQGIEFDYCCVHAAFSLTEAGYETIMINCNPETVSTDYDTSDRLYFEPLTFEDVIEVIQRENPTGVIIHYGGQTPLRLAEQLQLSGVPIIGTSPEAIDITEDRKKFSELLRRCGLRQSENDTARNAQEAMEVASRIGFPLLVRPSFVLGGRAMVVVSNHEELNKYINESVLVSFDRPVLLDRFLDNAIEIDVDAVCDGKNVLVCGIMEHIERAGIHSGDSSFFLPSQTLSEDVIAEIERATHALALECNVVGIMNVQYAVRNKTDVYVIEVNPRASRSVPFVSKVMGTPWAKIAARVMAGESLIEIDKKGDYGNILRFSDYRKAVKQISNVTVKRSVFPFAKFRGIDTLLGPEMRSTGEVMGIDINAGGAFSRAEHAAGHYSLPTKGVVFLSLRDEDKEASIPIAKRLINIGFQLIATKGTAKYLSDNNISVKQINKVRDGSPHVVDELLNGNIDMVINTPEGTGPLLDSRSIRSTATALELPLYTTIAAADAVVTAIEQLNEGRGVEVCSLQEHIANQAPDKANGDEIVGNI
jgi:carbamoyl-phosphate synthase large subunit